MPFIPGNGKAEALPLTRRTALAALGVGAIAQVIPPWMRPASAAPTAGDIANATGTVKALVWEGYEAPEALKTMKGISVEAGYLAANEDTISKTGAPGAFDLITIYQGMIDPLIHLDRIQPIDPALLANFGQLFPFFRDAEGLRRAGRLFGVPYLWGTMKVLYDADQMDAPSSFHDLMAPALKGKIALPDDAYAVITTFARYAGFEHANRLTHAELTKVVELMDAFKPQVLSIAPSYGELSAMYSRGEIAASLPDWAPTELAARAAGRNVRSTIPAEGAFSFIDSWMVVTGASNEASAYALIDRAIGVEAQHELAELKGLGIVNADAAANLREEVASTWGYKDLAENFTKAPIFSGAPIEKDGDISTYQEWLKVWTQYKAS